MTTNPENQEAIQEPSLTIGDIIRLFIVSVLLTPLVVVIVIAIAERDFLTISSRLVMCWLVIKYVWPNNRNT